MPSESSVGSGIRTRPPLPLIRNPAPGVTSTMGLGGGMGMKREPGLLSDPDALFYRLVLREVKVPGGLGECSPRSQGNRLDSGHRQRRRYHRR